jgi:hypothetical protein
MSNQDGSTDGERPTGPDDAALLTAVARVWQHVDPPPVDLADGVLARIAAEDLEFDLLTLVEPQDALDGVRSAAEVSEDPESDETGSWSLEYLAPDLRVYLRLTRIEERTRIDGWVVPARPLTVRLSDVGVPMETPLDEFGRFEFADAPAGLARLLLIEETTPAARPRITPPFWI